MPDYGRGMVGLYSLECSGKLTNGLQSAIQDVYHLLITVRGSLPANPELGLGLLDLILSGLTTETLPAIDADIESEIPKDERFESAESTSTVDKDGALVLSLTVKLAAGPSFKLVGPIGNVRAELL